MTPADIFVVAYLFGIVIILYICAWVKDDGHKKLLAAIIRRIEARKRKKRKDI